MKNKLSMFALYALGFLIAAGTVNAAAYCQTGSGIGFKIIGINWGTANHTISAGPGNRDVPLTVTLQTYNSACNLFNVQGTLQLGGSLTNFNGSSISNDYVQELTSSQLFSMVFYLNIANNTAVGPNTVLSYPLYIAWNYTNSTIRNTQQINLGIPLRGSSDLSYSTPNPALPGGKLYNFTLEVTNAGTGYLSGISTSVEPASGVSILSQPQEISSLSPGSSRNVSVYFYVGPSSTGSPVTLNLDSHYLNPYGYNTSETEELGLYVVPSSQGAVTVSASNQSLLSGLVDPENIILTNNGTDTITNITILLAPSSGLSLIDSDGFKAFQSIMPGQSVEFPVKLYVQPGSAADVASLGATLTYVDNGQSESTSRSISFLTPSYINFTEVNNVLLPSVPALGSIFSLTSTLNNLGSGDAYGASVMPEPPSGFKIVGYNTTFIGNIAVGSPTSFTVSFDVSASVKPGSYIIPVILSYTNNLNQKVSRTLNYTVDVGAAYASGTAGSGNSANIYTGSGQAVTVRRKEGDGGLLLLIAIVVILIVAYYLYRKIKKNKANK